MARAPKQAAEHARGEKTRDASSVAATGSQTQSVPIGLIGAGTFAGFHANKIASLKGAHLCAVYDQDKNAAEQLAERQQARTDQACQTPGSLQAVIDQSQAIIIACPARAHAHAARLALEAGLDVFIEKPIATTINDAQHLVDLASAKNLILQIGHQERYVANAIGLFNLPQPDTIICERISPPSNRGTDVSVILDLMIHDLDLAAQFIGNEPIDISATGDIDAVTATLQSPACTISCTASRKATSPKRSLTLGYADGSITLDFLTRTITNTTSHKFDGSFQGGDALNDPLMIGASAFINSIIAREQPMVHGAAGLQALKLAIACEQAAGINTAASAQSERKDDSQKLSLGIAS